MQPLVYIIVLSWNRKKHIVNLIEQVKNLNYSNFKLVIIDNNSNEDTKNALRNLVDIEVIYNSSNLGFTGGCNIGISLALQRNADYVWMLNDDTQFDNDSLSKLVKKASECEKIGLVSPLIFHSEKRDEIQFCGSAMTPSNKIRLFSTVQDYKNAELHKEKILLWGTALLANAIFLRETSGFDEKYFAYWEDSDLSMSSIEKGYQNVVSTNSTIYHDNPIVPDGSKERSSYYYFYRSRNRYLFWRKYLKKREYSFLDYFSSVLLIVSKCLSQSNKEGAEAALDGMWAAITNQYGEYTSEKRCPWLIKKIITISPYRINRIISGKY